MLVLDSSPSLPAKQRHSILCYLGMSILKQILKFFVGETLAVVLLIVVVAFLRYIRDFASSLPFVLQVS